MKYAFLQSSDSKSTECYSEKKANERQCKYEYNYETLTANKKDQYFELNSNGKHAVQVKFNNRVFVPKELHIVNNNATQAGRRRNTEAKPSIIEAKCNIVIKHDSQFDSKTYLWLIVPLKLISDNNLTESDNKFQWMVKKLTESDAGSDAESAAGSATDSTPDKNLDPSKEISIESDIFPQFGSTINKPYTYYYYIKDDEVHHVIMLEKKRTYNITNNTWTQLSNINQAAAAVVTNLTNPQRFDATNDNMDDQVWMRYNAMEGGKKKRIMTCRPIEKTGKDGKVMKTFEKEDNYKKRKKAAEEKKSDSSVNIFNILIFVMLFISILSFMGYMLLFKGDD